MGERSKPVLALLDVVTQAIVGVVNIIMRLAPIGAFGAMAFTLGKYGGASLGPLLARIATFYVTCIAIVVVVQCPEHTHEAIDAQDQRHSSGEHDRQWVATLAIARWEKELDGSSLRRML